MQGLGSSTHTHTRAGAQVGTRRQQQPQPVDPFFAGLLPSRQPTNLQLQQPGCILLSPTPTFLPAHPSCPPVLTLPPQQEVRRSLISATAATSLMACFLMGAVANLPLAVAPGMGINAYFAYTVVGFLGTGKVTGRGSAAAPRRCCWCGTLRGLSRGGCKSLTSAEGGLLRQQPQPGVDMVPWCCLPVCMAYMVLLVQACASVV